MKPTRKQELEYYDSLIDSKFIDKQNNLERAFNNEVDKVVQKSFKAFKKRIKIEGLMKDYIQAKKEYDVYKASKDMKEKALYNKAEERCQKIKSFIAEKSEVNQWDVRLSDKWGDDTLHRPDEIESALKNACKVEAKRFVVKQPIKKEMEELEAKKEEARNILYSGASLLTIVQELHKVFAKSNIRFQLPTTITTPQIAVK